MAIADFSLIKEGDRVAVALSGGKDSFGLITILSRLQRKSPVHFELLALTIHNGSPDFNGAAVGEYLQGQNIPFHLEETGIVKIVEAKRRPGSSYCSFCARLRRGALYGAARRLGCNKLALGHHLDDAAETLLMNLFFGGSLKAMPPKLLAENGTVSVIRPLAYVEETMLMDFALERGFPIIGCGCSLCGNKEQERARMKHLIEEVATRYPEVRRSVLSALSNAQPRFLMDRNLYNFEREEAP